MFDWIFAFVHLFALLAAFGYAVYCLAAGNRLRGGLIILLLAVYYVLVLHKAVKKEIARKKDKSSGH